ncbi:MAG: TPM domain-containing protein [Oscillospiraceae bacterium]|nr:TPM domain-containing protein [Oscillospiraceae bacterium]
MNEENIKEKYLRLNKTKLQTAKVISVLMIVAAFLLSVRVFEKPQKPGMSPGVYDDANILSDGTIQKMNGRGAALSELTGGKAKIAVFTEKDKSGKKDLEKMAGKLFESHEMGDEGLLFVVCVEKSSGGIGENIGHFFEDLFGGGSQPYAYHKGRNVDYISDGQIKEILGSCFAGSGEESFDSNGAFLAAYDNLADLFDDHHKVDSHGHESNVVSVPVEPESKSNIAGIVQVAVGTAALFVILFLALGILGGKKKPGASRVYKKPLWFN